jgi:hypothetical protein
MLLRMVVGNGSDRAAPAPVDAFVRAVNASDLDGLLDVFGERAMVNDQLREYWGKPSIKEWAARDVIGQALTMRVTKIATNGDHTLVEAHVNGAFDRRGLPDPLLISFYFSTRENEIVQLIILRNEPASGY